MATTAEAPAFEIKDEQRPLTEIPIDAPGETVDATEAEAGKKEQLTVFHSADNFNVKHPLMNKWTLWFTKPPTNKVRDGFPAGYGCLLIRCARPRTGTICSRRL